jgi:hypothetical protein
MVAPAPVYRGQANAFFRTDKQDRSYARGQDVPYNINGAPTGAFISDGNYGDATISGGGTAIDLNADVVGNTELSNMAQSTVKGRAAGAGMGDPQDLSVAQLKALLALAIADITGLTAVLAAKRDLGSVDATLTATSYLVKSDATAGPVTVNLPSAASSVNRVINIKKVDASANTVTVDGNGTETIDGGLTAVLTIQWESITLISDGSQWLII